MPTRTRLFTAAVTGALVAASLSGCGSDDKDEKKMADLSVEDIEKESKEAMGELTSLTYTLRTGSGATESVTEVSAEIDGDCAGTVDAAGSTTEFIRLKDGSSFMKADAAVWQAQAPDQADQIIAMLGDKYAKMPSGQDPFGDPCDLEGLIESIIEDDEDDEEAKITKGDVTDVDGVEALELTSVEGEETTTLWVSNEDAWILKAEQQGAEGLTMEFADFDDVPDVEQPSKDEYVDLGGQ